MSILTCAYSLMFSVLTIQGGVAQSYDYDPERSAILLVDPYNEFLSEGGILYPLSKETLDANNAIENMKKLVDGARQSGDKVMYVQHNHIEEGD